MLFQVIMVEKWTSEEILRFLEVYEKYEILWNNRLAEYRDKTSREIALGQMLQELNMEGLTLDIARSKIKMIKTVYNQERNKINKSVGLRNGYVYKPKLAWYDKADSFLRSVAYNKTNLKRESEEREDDSEEGKADIYFQEENKQNKKLKTSLKRQLVRGISGRKLKNLDVRKKQQQDMNSTINTLSNVVTETTSKDEDEFDHFGKYIACQMRQLPVINALHCQEQILSIVTQERIAAIQQAELETEESSSHWNSTQNNFD